MTRESGHDHAACRELAARLSEYLDHELSEAECRRLEEHFRDCPPCVEFLESVRATVDWIRAASRPRMPGEMRAELARALRAARESEA